MFPGISGCLWPGPYEQALGRCHSKRDVSCGGPGPKVGREGDLGRHQIQAIADPELQGPKQVVGAY